MSVAAIMKELAAMGSEQTRKTYARHGAPASIFGVKIGDMKAIVKRVKKNHELALELYATGNSDAMYLAGLVADETRMTKADLERWAKGATWYMISYYPVAWVTAESPHGWALGNKWIDSKNEMIACAGWCTLAGWVSLRPDEELDIPAIEALLGRVAKGLKSAPNYVRYCMNGFIISVGGHVAPLTAEARKTAKAVGKVEVDMGDTACKVPDATSYIAKMESTGRLGKKKKQARC